MTGAKKTADKAVGAKTTEVTQAVKGETFAERVTRETTEATNVVQGKTEPRVRDLKNEEEQLDEQARINKEVEEAQTPKGSTASKTAGPKYSQR